MKRPGTPESEARPARKGSLLQRAARMLGLNTAEREYAYGLDPRFGYTSASRIADTWTKTTCGYCSVGCGMLIGTREGVPVAARGNPDHPVNRGKLCPRDFRSTTLCVRRDGRRRRCCGLEAAGHRWCR